MYTLIWIWNLQTLTQSFIYLFLSALVGCFWNCTDDRLANKTKTACLLFIPPLCFSHPNSPRQTTLTENIAWVAHCATTRRLLTTIISCMHLILSGRQICARRAKRQIDAQPSRVSIFTTRTRNAPLVETVSAPHRANLVFPVTVATQHALQAFDCGRRIVRLVNLNHFVRNLAHFGSIDVVGTVCGIWPNRVVCWFVCVRMCVCVLLKNYI